MRTSEKHRKSRQRGEGRAKKGAAETWRERDSLGRECSLTQLGMQHSHRKPQQPNPWSTLTPVHTLPRATRRPQPRNPNCSSFSTGSKKNPGLPHLEAEPEPSTARSPISATSLCFSEREMPASRHHELQPTPSATGNDFKEEKGLVGGFQEACSLHI